MGALEMALEAPWLFNQIWHDLDLTGSPAAAWKRPGESASQARDRLRAEREAARARAR